MKFWFKFLSLIVCIAMFYNNAEAQTNLVPNYSFESFTACPTTYGRIPDAPPWQLVTGASGTPDYFNACSGSTWGVPVNTYGTQAAATGNAYIGMIGCYQSGSNYREYAQVKMDSAMVAGECYRVALKWSLAESAPVALDNFGLYFSATAPTGSGWANIAVTPQVRNPAGQFMTDKTNWGSIVDTIKATGTELWLTIGNFYGTTTPTVPVTGGSRSYSIYYVDDVEVWHVPCNAAPSPPVVTNNDTVCQGDSVMLVATGGSGSYTWYPSGNSSNVISTNASVWVSPPSTMKYVVSSGGTTDTAEVFVVPNFANAGLDQTICAGDSASLGGSPTGPTGATYNWSPATGLNNATIANPNASPASSQQYIVTVTNGKCSATDTVNVSIQNGIPASRTAAICQGDSIFLGGNYQKVAGSYIDTITVPSSCDTILTTTLTINPVKATASSQTICIGDSIMIAGQYRKAAGAYADTLQTSLGCDSVHTINLSVYVPGAGAQSLSICDGDSAQIAGIYRKVAGVYTDTAQTSLGCDSIINVTLTVNPVYNDSGVVNICQGDSIQIAGNWQKTAGYYSATYSSVNGCDSTEVLELKVLQPVSLQLADSVCQGDSLQFGSTYLTAGGTYVDTFQSVYGCDSIVSLTFTIRQRIPINAYGDTLLKIGQSSTIGVTGGTGSYTWTPPTGLSCASCPKPVANPTESTWYFVSSGSGGCMAIDSVFIEIDASFFLEVPNVFTPNGDGKNDVFKITAEGVESYDLKIFNRWGQLLFQRNSGPMEWDGRMSSGVPASDGTYFFVLEVTSYTGQTEVRKGTAALIK